jgi:predicted phosphate transport protein (TIGR00153 family)
MLNTILNLFGPSPFIPLQSHMDQVSLCVHRLPELFAAIEAQDYAQRDSIAEQISQSEHLADLMKNDIRNHMSKGLYLPIDRSHLLDILTIQDRIADIAEDIAILSTFKPLIPLEALQEDFHQFLNENIASFDAAHRIIKEIDELLESSFGGVEAQKVLKMVDEVAFKEHEVDVIQRKLIKNLFQSEALMTYSTFDLWQRLFQAIAAISNLSENLADRVRMTLELK